MWRGRPARTQRSVSHSTTGRRTPSSSRSRRSRGGSAAMRPWRTTTIAAATAAAIVVVAEVHAGLVPGPHRDAPMRAVLEASASLVALLTAYLVIGRVRESGRVADLMLACALC